MKILGISDLHIRDTIPAKRIDEYYSKQFEKLNFVINLANSSGCDIMLQAGDFFDYSTDKVNYDLKSKKFQILF